MTFVYEIFDNYGNVVKVGQTKDAKRRQWEWIKHPKSPYNGMAFNVVGSFDTKEEALDLEEALQLEYGMVSDRTKCRRAARLVKTHRGGAMFQKDGGRNGGISAASIERTCKCGMTIKGPAYFNHIKKCK